MRTRWLSSLLVALALFAPNARATWSIVIVDSATGEVAVASATCVSGIDLKQFLPVIVVGKGAGAAQSAIDVTLEARALMRAEIIAGTSPEAIIELLKQNVTAPQGRQWGVALPGQTAASASGASVGDSKGEFVGSIGSIDYTIQGNVLAGEPVLVAAERALRATEGRLSDRLMAAMEAAMLMGGDGRCSCLPNDPTACGSPPAEFTKSAHIGFLTVARVGDITGLCNAQVGCAAGTYWLDLNVIGGAQAPDPVLTLRNQYDAFVSSKRSFTDGVLSEAAWDGAPGSAHTSVPADGHSARVLRISLRDINGAPLPASPKRITAEHHGTSDDIAERLRFVDLGSGQFELHVQAGTRAGTDVFRIRIQDPTGTTVLFPLPSLEHLPLDG
ncbi:MAG: hypothetical protein DHS20C15_06450 [Planctomycetota bacterium]|nr:MAG: hypothetical protein DHS20C15_06450 [Planctomycetota bacterium]